MRAREVYLGDSKLRRTEIPARRLQLLVCNVNPFARNSDRRGP